MNTRIRYSDEVDVACREGQPLVALESTIIAHGMPWPKNAETALQVEQLIRNQGAIPATIAIIDGCFCAGLSTGEIEKLAEAGPAVAKCSHRDLPFALAKKSMGATTVAATMIIAQMAGIRLFATGGIGGVHRGAENSMDISADLQQLAQSDVAVVCAGAKSILDIGLTLEYLETLGVSVVGYRCDRMPAFYCRSSEYFVHRRLDDVTDIAEVLYAKWRYDLCGGMVIANPIPVEHALSNEQMEGVISQAVEEANIRKISGKELTPYLLRRVAEMTAGESLTSNIELMLNNARLAAEVAIALRNLDQHQLASPLCQ